MDLADIAGRLGAIIQAIQSLNPAASATASGLLRSRFDPRSKPLSDTYLAGGVDLAIRGRLDDMFEVAESLALDGELCTSLIRLSLLTQLAAYTAVLAKVRDTATWNRGDCPNCGRPPLLAETRGLEAKRYLRCGICAADWPFARLRCPACDTTDHRKLATRFAEGEGERYKLALCESCGYQIRVVATLEALSIPGLLVAELATSHLAYLAEVSGD